MIGFITFHYNILFKFYTNDFLFFFIGKTQFSNMEYFSVIHLYGGKKRRLNIYKCIGISISSAFFVLLNLNLLLLFL